MPADRVVEGRWDCDACGNKGIGGLKDSCPSCGQRRPEGVEFYLTSDAEEITDPQLIEQALSGGDWQCNHCGYHNRAYQMECSGCGAPQDDDVERIPLGEFVPTEQLIRSPSTDDRDQVREHYPDEVLEHQNLEPTLQSSRDKRASQSSSNRPSIIGFRWSGWIVGVLIALLVTASGWGVYEAFIKTHDVAAQVTAFSWSRETQVEIYGTVREEGWSIPDGGRKVSQQEKFHHNDRVLSHYETKTRQVPYTESRQESYSCSRSNGNGTFSTSTCYRTVSDTKYRTETYQEAVYRDVPVYETWYTYDIEKWHYSHTEKESGRDQKPFWPEVLTNATQREGRRTETYTLYFLDEEGREFESNTDLATWQSATMNQKVILKLNRQQSLRDFELVVS